MHLTTQLGSTAVGVCTKEGVILAVEKRISSSLLEPSRYGAPRIASNCVNETPSPRMYAPIMIIQQPTPPNSVEKIMEVDTHIGAAMSGLMPDARTLVDHARVGFSPSWYLLTYHVGR